MPLGGTKVGEEGFRDERETVGLGVTTEEVGPSPDCGETSDREDSGL